MKPCRTGTYGEAQNNTGEVCVHNNHHPQKHNTNHSQQSQQSFWKKKFLTSAAPDPAPAPIPLQRIRVSEPIPSSSINSKSSTTIPFSTSASSVSILQQRRQQFQRRRRQERQSRNSSNSSSHRSRAVVSSERQQPRQNQEAEAEGKEGEREHTISFEPSSSRGTGTTKTTATENDNETLVLVQTDCETKTKTKTKTTAASLTSPHYRRLNSSHTTVPSPPPPRRILHPSSEIRAFPGTEQEGRQAGHTPIVLTEAEPLRPPPPPSSSSSLSLLNRRSSSLSPNKQSSPRNRRRPFEWYHQRFGGSASNNSKSNSSKKPVDEHRSTTSTATATTTNSNTPTTNDLSPPPAFQQAATAPTSVVSKSSSSSTTPLVAAPVAISTTTTPLNDQEASTREQKQPLNSSPSKKKEGVAICKISVTTSRSFESPCEVISPPPSTSEQSHQDTVAFVVHKTESREQDQQVPVSEKPSSTFIDQEQEQQPHEKDDDKEQEQHQVLVKDDNVSDVVSTLSSSFSSSAPSSISSGILHKFKSSLRENLDFLHKTKVHPNRQVQQDDQEEPLKSQSFSLSPTSPPLFQVVSVFCTDCWDSRVLPPRPEELEKEQTVNSALTTSRTATDEEALVAVASSDEKQVPLEQVSQEQVQVDENDNDISKASLSHDPISTSSNPSEKDANLESKFCLDPTSSTSSPIKTFLPWLFSRMNRTIRTEQQQSNRHKTMNSSRGPRRPKNAARPHKHSVQDNKDTITDGKGPLQTFEEMLNDQAVGALDGVIDWTWNLFDGKNKRTDPHKKSSHSRASTPPPKEQRPEFSTSPVLTLSRTASLDTHVYTLDTHTNTIATKYRQGNEIPAWLEKAAERTAPTALCVKPDDTATFADQSTLVDLDGEESLTLGGGAPTYDEDEGMQHDSDTDEDPFDRFLENKDLFSDNIGSSESNISNKNTQRLKHPMDSWEEEEDPIVFLSGVPVSYEEDIYSDSERKREDQQRRKEHSRPTSPKIELPKHDLGAEMAEDEDPEEFAIRRISSVLSQTSITSSLRSPARLGISNSKSFSSIKNKPSPPRSQASAGPLAAHGFVTSRSYPHKGSTKELPGLPRSISCVSSQHHHQQRGMIPAPSEFQRMPSLLDARQDEDDKDSKEHNDIDDNAPALSPSSSTDSRSVYEEEEEEEEEETKLVPTEKKSMLHNTKNVLQKYFKKGRRRRERDSPESMLKSTPSIPETQSISSQTRETVDFLDQPAFVKLHDAAEQNAIMGLTTSFSFSQIGCSKSSADYGSNEIVEEEGEEGDEDYTDQEYTDQEYTDQEYTDIEDEGSDTDTGEDEILVHSRKLWNVWDCSAADQLLDE